ncbi:branched-chain amino acid ABC transporter permease [Ferribacterium limneticum]|uniref:branched-chain amino acid ABC transporter permease n=1 Tax=Ferribacterium limneticum TaxID=76259 RepID=UPI001CFBB30F|nr:branched-chain amino acid ABC transporter permease [Ferribacterium limneticum]UCV28801.1 branched-chain amino acid ABC transporter permease [Ferribacterium limneticum]UCV32718.1 branched-chain amino acid ABC transporter permease [Ferribacterium limneticum]
MDIFLQQIINGLVQGSIYALVALGYTMVYGIMGLINFAHGEVVMIGTLVTITVAGSLIKAGMPVVLAGLAGVSVSVLVCMALGWGLERIAYRPLRNAPRLTPLITAIGMSIVLQNLAMMIWGRNYLTFPSLLPKVNFELAGAHFTAIQVIIVAVSGITMGGLLLLVYRTKLGMAMRATAQNPAVASLMGVNINRVIAAAFVIGSALGAVAGIMVGGYYEIAHYQMGFMLGLKAFTAAVLGGIGNLGGAMLGGILLGIIEALGAGYIGDLTGGFLGSHYQDIFAFVVLIVVLMFKPSGLFGEKTGDRA